MSKTTIFQKNHPITGDSTCHIHDLMSCQIQILFSFTYLWDGYFDNIKSGKKRAEEDARIVLQREQFHRVYSKPPLRIVSAAVLCQFSTKCHSRSLHNVQHWHYT